MPAETLASALGRTTSFLPLPNALLTSLGMPADENMTDVRQVRGPAACRADALLAG